MKPPKDTDLAAQLTDARGRCPACGAPRARCECDPHEFATDCRQLYRTHRTRKDTTR